MERALVVNETTCSCCGLPVRNCACLCEEERKLNRQGKPAPIPVMNWQRTFEAEAAERKRLNNAKFNLDQPQQSKPVEAVANGTQPWKF